QIIDNLQTEKDVEKNNQSDYIYSDLQRSLSKKEGKQKVIFDDLHVDERPADRDVQQMVMEGSPTFQVINESGVTFDESISPKRTREGNELKDSISFLVHDNTNKESLDQPRVKRTRQYEETKIDESCDNATKERFNPKNLSDQSHYTNRVVDMRSNSEKPNSELTFPDEIFEIEERLEQNEEIYKENPLRLLMEVALVDL
ncbi:1744_t:CDS:1, partial [Scutellospora calospora]